MVLSVEGNTELWGEKIKLWGEKYILEKKTHPAGAVSCFPMYTCAHCGDTFHLQLYPLIEDFTPASLMFRVACIRSALKISRGNSKKFSSVPSGAYLPKTDVESRVLNVIKSMRSVPLTVSADDHVVGDLKFDTMLRDELTERLSEEFCVTISKSENEKFLYINDMIAYLSTHPNAR
jgi:acyl carrier protein